MTSLLTCSGFLGLLSPMPQSSVSVTDLCGSDTRLRPTIPSRGVKCCIRAPAELCWFDAGSDGIQPICVRRNQSFGPEMAIPDNSFLWFKCAHHCLWCCVCVCVCVCMCVSYVSLSLASLMMCLTSDMCVCV